jgi:hypothetical protein
MVLVGDADPVVELGYAYVEDTGGSGDDGATVKLNDDDDA